MLRHFGCTQILVSNRTQYIPIYLVLTFPDPPGHFGTICVQIFGKLVDLRVCFDFVAFGQKFPIGLHICLHGRLRVGLFQSLQFPHLSRGGYGRNIFRKNRFPPFQRWVAFMNRSSKTWWNLVPKKFCDVLLCGRCRKRRFDYSSSFGCRFLMPGGKISIISDKFYEKCGLSVPQLML